MKRVIKDIPRSKIAVIGNVRRVDASDPDIQELAASMQANGQEIEVRVFPMGDQYGLKAGHRRIVAAFDVLGWPTIRAVVEEAPEDAVAV